MWQRRRLFFALCVSLVVHGALLVWLQPPERERQAPVTLEVVLESHPEPDPRDPEPRSPPQLAPELVVLDPPPAAPPEKAEPVPELPREPAEDESTRMVLNLERPENWQPIVEETGPPPISIPFNPDLEEGVVIRESDKKRKALVDARIAAVYGVSDEAYTRETGVGTEMKIKGRCYVLKEDALEGTSWWPSQCTDTRQNPFTLPSIEYDPIGRVIAD